MEREINVIELKCPFCGHTDFLKEKDEVHDENGLCLGEFYDAWDCTCCGERIELGLDSWKKEWKEFKYYIENNDWEGLMRFCQSEEFDETALIFLAKYYLKNREWEKAKKIAEVMVRINPEDFEGQIIIGRIKKKDHKLRINATTNQLIDAFQKCNKKKLYFLDLTKKEVTSYTPELNALEEIPMKIKIKSEIEANPTKFLKIPLKNVQDTFNLINSFIHELGEHQGQTNAAQILLNVIQKNKSIQSFKDTIAHYPKIQEQWFVFERSVNKEIVLDWVCAHNFICTSEEENENWPK